MRHHWVPGEVKQNRHAFPPDEITGSAKNDYPAGLSLFIYGGSSFRNRLAIHFRGLTL